MSASELMRLKELEGELSQYKKMYAELVRSLYRSLATLAQGNAAAVTRHLLLRTRLNHSSASTILNFLFRKNVLSNSV